MYKSKKKKRTDNLLSIMTCRLLKTENQLHTVFMNCPKDQIFRIPLPTLNVEAGCGLLVSTNTAVVSTVFWDQFVDQEFIHRVLLLHLVLFSRLQELCSLLPVNRNSRFGDHTLQRNAGSLLSLLVLQLLLEGHWLG